VFSPKDVQPCTAIRRLKDDVTAVLKVGHEVHAVGIVIIDAEYTRRRIGHRQGFPCLPTENIAYCANNARFFPEEY